MHKTLIMVAATLELFGCGTDTGSDPNVIEPLHYQTTIDGSRAPWRPK